MVLRLIDASQARPGSIILIENEPYTVKSNDRSKPGKHGPAKCRIEAIGVFSDKKKIIAVSGAERFDVPNVDKRKAQVLNVGDKTASIMDLENYETIDIPYMEELKEQLAPEKHVEYWDVEGTKKIMRVL